MPCRNIGIITLTHWVRSKIVCNFISLLKTVLPIHFKFLGVQWKWSYHMFRGMAWGRLWQLISLLHVCLFSIYHSHFKTTLRVIRNVRRHWTNRINSETAIKHYFLVFKNTLCWELRDIYLVTMIHMCFPVRYKCHQSSRERTSHFVWH